MAGVPQSPQTLALSGAQLGRIASAYVLGAMAVAEGGRTELPTDDRRLTR